MSRRLISYVLVALVALGLGSVLQPFAHVPDIATAQGNCRTFTETNHTVCGRFWQYWQTHGGLAQQGYPISEEFSEVSDLNGQSYTVQYFERAVFEYHPENPPPNDVLLSQLGTFRLKEKYPNGAPTGEQPVPPTVPPAPPPAPGVQTFTGSGTQATEAFPLKAGAARFRAAVRNNTSNFIVWLKDANGEDVELIANEIGDADTSMLTSIPSTGFYVLNVTSDGDWTITVQQ